MNLTPTIARAGPWLAPITPAYLIARSTAAHLDAPLIVAIAAGATVEAAGIAVSHNALRLAGGADARELAKVRAYLEGGEKRW